MKRVWQGGLISSAWGYIALAWNEQGAGHSCLPQREAGLAWESLKAAVGSGVNRATLPASWVVAWHHWTKGDDGLLRELPITGMAPTSFAARVCLALRAIPRGEVRTYAYLASQAGQPSGARAAGQALAHNPLPLILPCHRVVQASGQVGGFAGRQQRQELKIELLTWEGIRIQNRRVVPILAGRPSEHHG